MSYASNLGSGSLLFTVAEFSVGGLDSMAFVGAVFTPATIGALSAANTIIRANPSAILANGSE